MALMTTHLLKTHPDVGLDVFDKMTQMNRAIGIGQGTGDEDFAWFHRSIFTSFTGSGFWVEMTEVSLG
jgi:hypothetical protein